MLRAKPMKRCIAPNSFNKYSGAFGWNGKRFLKKQSTSSHRKVAAYPILAFCTYFMYIPWLLQEREQLT